jgi:hypothetical protein
LILSELGRRHFRLGQREELPLSIPLGHQRLERVREPIGRAPLRHHRPGDELCDRRIAHPIGDRADDVDGADHRFGLVALIEQRDHVLGREPAGRVSHLLEDPLELLGGRPRHVLGQAAQHAEEGGGLDVDALALGHVFELRHELVELRGVPDDVDERAHRRVVQQQLGSPEGRGEDLVDRRRLPLLLAQHFGVVDFHDLEARPAGRVPQLRDAAVGADFFGRAGQQQQQRAPGLGVRGSVHGERANHVAVQDLGQFGDRGIGAGRQRAVEQERVGADLQREGAARGQARGGLRQPGERRGDGRVTAGVQRHRARRRFARARKLGELDRVVRPKRRGFDRIGHGHM